MFFRSLISSSFHFTPAFAQSRLASNLKPMPKWLSRGFRHPTHRQQAILFSVGVSAWIAILYWYYMHEKRHTPTFKTFYFMLRHDPEVQKLIGDNIEIGRLGHVYGHVLDKQGSIDATYWVKGSQDKAKVHVKARRFGQERGKYDWRADVFDVTRLSDQSTISLKTDAPIPTKY